MQLTSTLPRALVGTSTARRIWGALRGAAPIVVFGVAAGCGSGGSMLVPGDDGGALDLALAIDLAPAPDLAPLPLPPPPQMSKGIGNVLPNMKLVTINFLDSGYVTNAEAFGDWVGTSDWLKAWGPEYGVTGVTHAMKVEIADKSPASLTDATLVNLIKTDITKMILPAPTDEQFHYMLYFPPTTNISDTSGSSLCGNVGGFAGYHSYASYLGKRFTYSVIGDCGTGPGDVTNTASHELAEAATDPFLDGYRIDAASGDPWSILNGQECGDLCEYGTSIYMGGFALTRIWSNAAAQKGADPCVPMAPPVYFNVYATPGGIPEVAAGEKVTFTITGFATGQTPPWAISLGDAVGADFTLNQQQAVLGAKTIFNHGSVTLTLTAPANAPGGSLGGALIISGPESNIWPVAYSVK